MQRVLDAIEPGALSSASPILQDLKNELPPILVVEDDPIDVWMLRNSLAAIGADHPLVLCADGREALAWLARAMKDRTTAPSQRPRLMLVDLRLPIIDGLTIISLVRAQPLFASVTIAAVSGSQDPADVPHAFAAGADHFISKPADTSTVRRLLDDTGLLDRDASGSHVSPGSRESPPVPGARPL